MYSATESGESDKQDNFNSEKQTLFLNISPLEYEGYEGILSIKCTQLNALLQVTNHKRQPTATSSPGAIYRVPSTTNQAIYNLLLGLLVLDLGL